MAPKPKSSKILLDIAELRSYLGGMWVHDGLNLLVYAKEIVSLIGFSGSGKTTLLNSILMLQKPVSGTIRVFGQAIIDCTESEAFAVQHRWGVMFQNSALFSSMTVLENIMFPFQEIEGVPLALQREVAFLKLMLVGLDTHCALKYPSELSGGMKKRVALARAIVLDPELVFLDEPTTGLDFKSAGEMDDLILELREQLNITFFMITHDVDTLWRVPDRVIFLGEGKVLAALPMSSLVLEKHPVIQDYFNGTRAAARIQRGEQHGG